ncbi:MAG: DUF2934 domain-containing protein [Candidatus Sulfotelmatobacter sp.]
MATPPRTKIPAVAPNDAGAAAQLQMQERIRVRAYELYEQRGKVEGHDLEDWLQAEEEVLPRSLNHA